MPVFNGIFPVLPGKEDDVRKFAAETVGPRGAAWANSQTAVGTTRETWSIQSTPMGSFVLVWFENDDVEAAFADLAANDDEFHTWSREQIKNLTGVDMAEPDDSPPPEVILDWTA